MQKNSQFTLIGPLIWCDTLQVRLWMILNINYNVSHHMGMSQMCTGADHYFRSSKPHSGKLCHTYLYMHVDYCWLFVQDVVSDHLICLQKVYRINIWLTLSLSIQNDIVLIIFRNIMNWTFFGIRGDNLLVVFWTTIMKHQRQLAFRQIMYRVSPKMFVLGWIILTMNK